MAEDDFRKTIEEVVQKLPDLVRADLVSRDPSARRSAEEVVTAKIILALNEVLAPPGGGSIPQTFQTSDRP